MNTQTANYDTPSGLPDWCAPADQKLSALIWSRTSRGYHHRRGVEEASRAKSRKSQWSRRTANEPLKLRLETRHRLNNWKQFKGKAQQVWGDLTDDELDIIQGNREELVGRLQKTYGYTKDQLHASSPLEGVAHFIELSVSDNRVEQFRSSMRRVSGGLIRQFLSGSRVTRAQAKQQLDGVLVGALDSFMVRLGSEAGLSTSIELDAARMGLLVDLVASRLGDLSEIDARRLSDDLVLDLRKSLLPGTCIGTARGFIRASKGSLVAILGNAPEPDQVISETSRWVPVDVRY